MCKNHQPHGFEPCPNCGMFSELAGVKAALGVARMRERRYQRAKKTRREVALEVNVEQEACRQLEAEGMWTTKHGKQGWPDRQVFIAPKHHVWFEFKRAKFASLTRAQKRRIPWLEARGEKVYLITSVAQALAVAKYEKGWARCVSM